MTDPTVPNPKPVRRNAEQDQRIANDITASGQFIDIIRNDPEIGTLMAERGYGTPKLDEGTALFRTAQTDFTHRQVRMAGQGHATASLKGAALTAREMYIDFRETVRAIGDFTAEDRKALNVNGAVPADRQKMITAARTSYEAGQQEPYATVLATYGYPAATLTNLLQSIETYSTADTDQNTAIGDAVHSTGSRNASVKALKAYMKQIRRIAKVALRKRPDLLKKLNP